MGSFNEDMFKNSFGFVKDLQQTERRDLERAVELEKNEYKKESLKLMLQRMVCLRHILFLVYLLVLLCRNPWKRPRRGKKKGNLCFVKGVKLSLNLSLKAKNLFILKKVLSYYI